MCGLIGIISKTQNGLPYKAKQMFEQMLYADTLRGDDSTGIFGINKHGNLKMIKSATPGHQFVETQTFKDFNDKLFTDYNVVVGHNRAATKGAKTDANAHPFIDNHICLVHNGTLTTHKHLADTEVDSHAICKSLAERGMEKTLPEIYGAFALIWYDAKEKKLHITRNDQRPLHIIEDKDACYIASEALMLEWLYARVYGKKETAKYFETGKLYTWDVDNLKDTWTNTDFPEKKVVSIQKYPVTTHSTGSTGTMQTNGRTSFRDYKQGQSIVFIHERNSVINERATFFGESWDEKKVMVQGTMDLKGKSAMEVEEILDGTEFLVGELFATHFTQGKTKYLVQNVRQADILSTVNGEWVSERALNEAGYCCHECGSIIDPELDDGKFWVRVKRNIIKKILCPICVEQNPNLSRGESECINELSSSHTNLEAEAESDWQNFFDNGYKLHQC